MKNLLFLPLFLMMSLSSLAQTVGSTKTEQYKASFETAIDISQFMDYEGKQIPIQILKAGISDEMYEMYPELKEKRVGLGVANISMEYLENLNRFKFTEDKTEIKNRTITFLAQRIIHINSHPIVAAKILTCSINVNVKSTHSVVPNSYIQSAHIP